MNLGTLLVGLILAFIIFSPVIMSVTGNSKRKSTLRFAILGKMSKNNLEIGKIDYAGNVAIAMDRDHSKLYFVNMDNLDWVQELELNKLLSCRKLHESRSFRSPYGMQAATTKIDLQFKLKDGVRNSVYFTLYDESNGMQLNNELHLATDWEKIINELISNGQSIPIRNKPVRRRA